MAELRVVGLASQAVLLALIVLPFPGLADAARGPAPYGAQDPGGINCKLMTEMYESGSTGTERQFFNFAQGYFLGRSAALPAASQRRLAASGPDRAEQFGRLLKYCADNPAATFTEAVVALWNSLQGRDGIESNEY